MMTLWGAVGKLSTQKLGDLPKDAQLVSGRTGIQN